MKVLFVGDIVARPGRELLRRGLKPLVRRCEADVVIVNIENAAGGAGVTREIADEVLQLGVHALTSGNHIWDKREVMEFINDEPRLIRPANYPTGAPGAGSFAFDAPSGTKVGVVNVMGRIFLANIDDPFSAAGREIASLRALGARIIIVDVHAEATSEKMALGWHLNGQATAVIGTHTHVQTADERVLPGGTAYITDVGMTGAHDGVIGMERTSVITRFMTGLPSKMENATGDVRLNAVVIDGDETTGHARSIARISLSADELL